MTISASRIYKHIAEVLRFILVLLKFRSHTTNIALEMRYLNATTLSLNFWQVDYVRSPEI